MMKSVNYEINKKKLSPDRECDSTPDEKSQILYLERIIGFLEGASITSLLQQIFASVSS